ncbi:MAG: hypothetical protein WC364_02905 [Eubacteriales bacterium]|jgi:hypothetical protein
MPWTNAARHSRRKNTHQSISNKNYSGKAVFKIEQERACRRRLLKLGEKNINNPFISFAKKHLSKIEIPQVSLREFLKIGNLRVLFLRINGNHDK